MLLPVKSSVYCGANLPESIPFIIVYHEVRTKSRNESCKVITSQLYNFRPMQKKGENDMVEHDAAVFRPVSCTQQFGKRLLTHRAVIQKPLQFGAARLDEELRNIVRFNALAHDRFIHAL